MNHRMNKWWITWFISFHPVKFKDTDLLSCHRKPSEPPSYDLICRVYSVFVQNSIVHYIVSSTNLGHLFAEQLLGLLMGVETLTLLLHLFNIVLEIVPDMWVSLLINEMLFNNLSLQTWMKFLPRVNVKCFMYCLLCVSSRAYLFIRSSGQGPSILSFPTFCSHGSVPYSLLMLRIMSAEGKRLYCTTSLSCLTWQSWLNLGKMKVL